MNGGDLQVAVAHLVLGYAELIDRGDLEGLADLLAHAELTAEGDPTTHRGRHDVLAHYSRWTRLHPGGTPLTKHVTTNLVVEADPADPDRATCRAYFTVLQAVPGELALQPIIAGRYLDRFERVDGAWRFSARHIVPELVGDLRAHLHHDLDRLS